MSLSLTPDLIVIEVGTLPLSPPTLKVAPIILVILPIVFWFCVVEFLPTPIVRVWYWTIHLTVVWFP